MGAHRVKTPFTLLEIVITCVLAPTLLIFLTKMATDVLKKTQYLERAQLAVHTKHLIHSRLSTLLATIDPHTLKTPNSHTLTFRTTDYLDPDPSYSGALPITLTLKDHTLILTIKDRTETLAENIGSLTIEICPRSFLRLRLTPTSREPPFQLAFFIKTSVQ